MLFKRKERNSMAGEIERDLPGTRLHRLSRHGTQTNVFIVAGGRGVERHPAKSHFRRYAIEVKLDFRRSLEKFQTSTL